MSHPYFKKTLSFVLLFAAPAHAGLKEARPLMISVDAVRGEASGSLSDVRQDLDPQAKIECKVFAREGFPTHALCNAGNSNQVVGCYTENSALISRLNSLNGDSFLRFDWDMGTGLCTYIFVENFPEDSSK